MLKWCHHIMSHFIVIKSFWEFFLKNKNVKLNGEQEKKINYLCEDGIENPFLGITICYHLASLMMLNSDPHDRFPYSTLTAMKGLFIVTIGQFSNLAILTLYPIGYFFAPAMTMAAALSVTPVRRYVRTYVHTYVRLLNDARSLSRILLIRIL